MIHMLLNSLKFCELIVDLFVSLVIYLDTRLSAATMKDRSINILPDLCIKPKTLCRTETLINSKPIRQLIDYTLCL